MTAFLVKSLFVLFSLSVHSDDKILFFAVIYFMIYLLSRGPIIGNIQKDVEEEKELFRKRGRSSIITKPSSSSICIAKPLCDLGLAVYGFRDYVLRALAHITCSFVFFLLKPLFWYSLVYYALDYTSSPCSIRINSGLTAIVCFCKSLCVPFVSDNPTQNETIYYYILQKFLLS